MIDGDCRIAIGEVMEVLRGGIMVGVHEQEQELSNSILEKEEEEEAEGKLSSGGLRGLRRKED